MDFTYNINTYSGTKVTWTLKEKEKQFEFIARNASYWGKFKWNFAQGKGSLIPVGREFKLSKFELLRFYCIIINLKLYRKQSDSLFKYEKW